MEIERPDLSKVAPEVVAYIEALEAELAERSEEQPERAPVPQEPPTTVNVISLSHHGRAKRTPRHFYGRQRRAGMGVFDLETTPPDYPAHLALADEEGHLLLVSNHGRAFRLPVNTLVETPVRAAGSLALGSLSLRENEHIAGVLPADSGKYLVMVSQRGWVQRVRDGYLGKSLINGMSFHNVKDGGLITAACWTNGDGDLFIATRQGKGIRFRESQASERGCLGLRVDVGDEVAAVTAVRQHLLALNAQLSKPRVFERNLRLDTPDQQLLQKRQLLRVRQDTAVTITFKSEPITLPDSEAKVREEIEFQASDAETAVLLFQRLGYSPVQVYEKYRETFQLGDVEIVLDELPFGNFVELEGPEAAIKTAAAELGLDWERRLLTNYLALMAQLQAHYNLPFHDLTFANFAGQPYTIADVLP